MIVLVTFMCNCSIKPKRIATRAEFDKQVQNAVDQDVNWMIGRIGPPSSTYEMPNANVQYIYEKSVDVTTPVVSSTNFIGDTVTTTGRDKISAACKIMFTVDKNTQKVISVNFYREYMLGISLTHSLKTLAR